MATVMLSFLAGLFVGEQEYEAVRDNLDLERWFRLPKSHERRIHGRRHAGIRIVVSALGAKPRLLGGLDPLVAGRPASEDTFVAVAAAAHKQCRPLTNVPYDDDWRHAMVPVLVTRTLRDAFDGEAA